MNGQENLSIKYLKWPLVKLFQREEPYGYIIYSSFKHKNNTKMTQKRPILIEVIKGVPFFHRRHTKGVPFLSKMVYKRVRRTTLGQCLPVQNFVEQHLGWTGKRTCMFISSCQSSVLLCHWIIPTYHSHLHILRI